MNRPLLFLNLVHAYTAATGELGAIVADGWNVVGLGIDDRPGGRGAGTPAVNAMQLLSKTVRLDKCTLYLSYLPTEACLGMARICRIRHIYVFTNNEIRRYSPAAAPDAHGGFLNEKPSTVELKQVGFKKKGGAPGAADLPADPTAGGFAWWNGIDDNVQAWYDADPARAILSFHAARSYRKVTPPALTAVPVQRGTVLRSRDHVRETIFMTTTYALAYLTWDRPVQWGGNKVACILVDPQDRIVGWGLNMLTAEGPTWHGETVTLRRYLAQTQQSTLGAGYTLYTTLKPCHMCAGMITTVADSMTIIYGQDDPEITHSALDRRPDAFVQRATQARRTAGQSFPELLQGMLLAAPGPNAIPFLENLTGPEQNATFGRAGWWLERLLRTSVARTVRAESVSPPLRAQPRHSQRIQALDLARPARPVVLRAPQSSSVLAALDLAVRHPRLLRDDIYVLLQGAELAITAARAAGL